MDDAKRRYSYLAWAVLAFTVLTVLGGAVVRATGSGDGCGNTWPVCSDRIFPTNAGIETAIEYGHRLMSAASILGILALFFLARRLFGRGEPARRAATAALVLIVIESLIGASLVLFGWVDDDASIGRMMAVSAHLVNTSLLVGALTLTAWWSAGNPAPRPGAGDRRKLFLGAAGLLIVALLGALNALADTLYPADDFLSGVSAELSSDAPFLVQMRVLHPLVAILVGAAVARIAFHAAGDDTTRRLGWIVVGLVLFQFAVGITNVFLVTPIETQVVHLAMANVIWITYLLFAASRLGEQVETAQPVPSAP